MNKQDRDRRFRQELLRIRAREALSEFRMALDGIILPPRYQPNPWKRSHLLAEARRVLDECRRLLNELDRDRVAGRQ
jgi:hypothetical protein